MGSESTLSTAIADLRGYNSPEYAEVFSEYGEIIPVCRQCNFDKTYTMHGYFLRRPIPGTDYTDLVTIYPFNAACERYSGMGLVHGVNKRSDVSVVIITDPLSFDDSRVITRCLTGIHWSKYKDHAVVNLKKYCTDDLPENHRRNIKKAWKNLKFGISKGQNLEKLYEIYQNLIVRHEIEGITKYSRDQFFQLFKVPGTKVITAYPGDGTGEPVAFSLFYIDGRNAYYHTSAQTPEGYSNAAMFGMMDMAIKLFRRDTDQYRCKWLELGGVADGTSGEGLWRFKSGFSTEILPNYIKKVVLNRKVYDKLSEGKTGNYFPLYRSP